MANVDNPHGFTFVRSANGNFAPPVEQAKLSASTDISVGDPLHMEADGYLDLALTTELIMGFAAEDITGAAATYPEVHYWPARVGDVWRAQMVTGVSFTQAVIGDGVAISGSTTGTQEVTNASAAAAPSLVFVGLADVIDGTGTANALGAHAECELEVYRPQNGLA